MLELRLGNTSEEVVVTLTELKTLNEPNYLFIFVHTLTKTTVAFVKLNTDDLSDFPERYNRFLFNTSVLFLNKPVGEWLYSVYEQDSETNTDPDVAAGLLEQGKMILNRATADEFEFGKYNESTSSAVALFKIILPCSSNPAAT